MKFIYADCLDYIDPGYDFISDRYAEGRQKYWDDQFAHEYMSHPPYDGILVSRGIVGDHLSKGKYTDSEVMRFRREGARAFLRYSEEKYPGSLIFGDCGAFQYVKMEVPPYTPEDMIEFYADGHFTHGCSIDHIIFLFDSKLDESGFYDSRVSEDARSRYEITLELAERFFKLSPKLGKRFTPLGVVQGWSPMSMARAAESLVRMGYSYLAIGGLVPLRTVDIHKILSAVRNTVPRDTRIHLLGFAKADQMAEFFQYGISSFDTSSPMIRAFKDGSRNYYLSNGSDFILYYQAIRIPQAIENKTLKKKILSGKCSPEDLLLRESRSLEAIRGYSNRSIQLEEAIEVIKDYSKTLFWKDDQSEDRNCATVDALANEYKKTLSARVWERCNCRACKELGVEVVIFRSSNRNKRRGMHNLAVFHDQVRRLREKND